MFSTRLIFKLQKWKPPNFPEFTFFWKLIKLLFSTDVNEYKPGCGLATSSDFMVPWTKCYKTFWENNLHFGLAI